MVQNALCCTDHLGDDLRGGTNLSDDPHRFADEDRCGVEIPCGNGILVGRNRFGQPRRQLVLVAVPPVRLSGWFVTAWVF